MSESLTSVAPPVLLTDAMTNADLERRFGGLRRLYGEQGYARLRRLRVAVVGLGGVGSWAVEALARSGVAALTLIDLDHVAESNINRQVQATSATLGMAKALALRERIGAIHPGCEVLCIDEFVQPDNWPALLPQPVDVLIDACDQVRAKAALAAWALSAQIAIVCVGAAGGKRNPASLEVDDLAKVTHDPLLASLRHRLRRDNGLKPASAFGVRCVFSREPVLSPEASAGEGEEGANLDGTLNCHGYGSSVMVTASFGMAAAAEAVRLALSKS